jgi:hypothetical protein
MVAALVARNANEAAWRLWWGLAESAFGGSMDLGSRFCVGAFGRNLVSVAVISFDTLIYFIKKKI